MTELVSRGERMAEAAEELEAFSGLKLLHMRRVVSQVLEQIGRDGIFREYTLHDISHIDALLGLQEWIVPDETWSVMTPTDALLQVLAIYLHDLGMLVTRQEYEQREASAYPEYKRARRGDGDFAAKVAALGEDAAERFLYQEWVRENHGARVRKWITGTDDPTLGVAAEAASQLNELLTPLGDNFRNDLALVCESHHLSDLANTDKYPVRRPYGRTAAEFANLQYAAVILRTVDLLHITSDRTPSVAFRFIAPTDPVSQQEWAKQRAVTAVWAKPATDPEGNVDSELQSDTIEVFAEFRDPEAYFGLTGYLTYAQEQITESYRWIADSQRRLGVDHAFPWMHIDETNIKASGFLPQRLTFVLDKSRVLNLLTGHTLYNNSNVVLRELVQNALDAVRLKQHQLRRAYEGRVEIEWDSAARILRIWDNGTGMTQEIITRHLLTVGSSRYQDDQFIDAYPTFSSISRFGIGVLSTFMLADEVSILTRDEDEGIARRLLLRTVHGRYLEELPDGTCDDDVKRLGAHGTLVELTVRPTARIGDIKSVLDDWIVVPRCTVTFREGSGDVTTIGFADVRDAMSSWLGDNGMTVVEGEAVGEGERGERVARVVAEEHDGLRVAVGLQWSAHFKEWSLISTDRSERLYAERVDRPDRPELGLCVEGIRVGAQTPGYRGAAFAAIADVIGTRKPTTDVSRSRVEPSPEYDAVITELYAIYARTVANEVSDLRSKRKFSLHRTAVEARYLMQPLVSSAPVASERLRDAVDRVPALVIDDGQQRLASAEELRQLPRVWTLHGPLFDSLAQVFREVPTTASIADVAQALSFADFPYPSEPVAYGTSSNPALSSLFSSKDVVEIVIRAGERRVDFAWAEAGEDHRWLSLQPDVRRYPRLRDARRHEYLDYDDRSPRPILVAGADIPVTGADGEKGVLVSGVGRLFYDTLLSAFLRTTLDKLSQEESEEAAMVQLALHALVGRMVGRSQPPSTDVLRQLVESAFTVDGPVRPREHVDRFMDLDSLVDALSVPVTLFDPTAWNRGSD